jgi:hypothetical protein
MVDKVIVSEIQADSLLTPIDQVYSSSTQLHGIKTVYKYISNATRSVMSNYRTHLPTAVEIDESIRAQSFKVGDINKILEYLTKKTPPNPSFCISYSAALFSDEKLLLKTVFLGGNDNIEKVIDKSDEISAKNIAAKASGSQPWADRISHGEFLTKNINEGKIHETYFLGYFKFDEKDTSKECHEIYEKRIVPLLRGRNEILFLEIPLSLRLSDDDDEPILLVNDHRDLKFRYEFLCGKLVAGAKKLMTESEGTESAYQIRKAMEMLKTVKSPETMKQLAAGVLAGIRKKSALRQIALEIFLMRNKAEEIIKIDRENKETENKLYLDLLNKRIRSRRWLLFVPASYYPSEVFAQALSLSDVMGAKKTGPELGAPEDYYCIIETQLLNPLLKTANWFELFVIEDILLKNRMAEKPFYKRSIYKRKKDIVFLSTNPFIYLLRCLLPGKRKFVENKFKNEAVYKGKIFTKGMKDCFDASGIKTDSELTSEKRERTKPTAKQLLMKKIIYIIFPDPAPSSRWINEIEYREKLMKMARVIKDDPEFPQYSGKNEEAIIADIEPFLKDELIEDIYTGTLPTGIDHKGRKFTRKIYAPRNIKDQRIVYETIREELEHESNSYGSRDIVDYYKARAKVFSETNMEKIKSSDRLKKEAEQKDRLKKTPSSSETLGKISSGAKTEDSPKKNSGSFFNIRNSKKAAVKSPQSLSSQQKIERTAKTLNAEMKEKYVTSRKYSGSNLFPITHGQMEELLDIEPGTLSMFSTEHSKVFSGNFIVIRAGKQIYYFPKAFFTSKKTKISEYYQSLIKHEENLALPNGEIVHKAQDILDAIRSKK